MRQAQRADHVPGELVPPRAAGDVLDGQSEQVVLGVRVRVAGPGRERRRLSGGSAFGPSSEEVAVALRGELTEPGADADAEDNRVAAARGELMSAMAAEPLFPPSGTDRPDKYVEPNQGYDYVKRVVEIPMRDGVKLHTVIVIAKGAKNAPILLTRTPYDADKRAQRTESKSMRAILPQGDELFVDAGYIRVFQDVRGKYKSEGEYVMTRPVRGPLNPTETDHVTDAYDTIDWLVKNTP